MTSSAHHLSAVASTSEVRKDIAITVPARADEVAGIRRAVGALARQARLDDERIADVALAVGEACANAVVHAYDGAAPGTLEVTAAVTRDGFEVTVRDDGRGLAPREDSPGLGLGLPLMASLTSALEFRRAPSGGTEVCMVFARAAPGADWAVTA